jgi:serine/threonine protein kinase
VINEQIGQYRITGRLGQGGMGEILAARDEKLNRTVAVKFRRSGASDSVERDPRQPALSADHQREPGGGDRSNQQ